MLGAIAGDIIGSIYENNKAWQSARTPHFEPLFAPQARFTDDTVLIVAVADSILHAGDLVDLFKDYARAYPSAGYGKAFRAWAASASREPYGSWGNGSAMRVSAISWAYDLLDEVLIRARWSSEITHDHPEAIRGAQAIAGAIYLARTGSNKEEIRAWAERKYRYDLGPTIEQIRPSFAFDSSCQGTVPAALIAFLDSTDYEHAVRLAVSLGGDTDTLACIAGSVAEAYYGGVPANLRTQALSRLDDYLKRIFEDFEERYCQQR
jgi:ADP-ribosylglycohydrolase